MQGLLNAGSDQSSALVPILLSLLSEKPRQPNNAPQIPQGGQPMQSIPYAPMFPQNPGGQPGAAKGMGDIAKLMGNSSGQGGGGGAAGMNNSMPLGSLFGKGGSAMGGVPFANWLTDTTGIGATGGAQLAQEGLIGGY